MSPGSTERAGRWLLLIHQIPPKPAYFRVKIGRHLARIGAVAIKNSVYVLPATAQAREDFAWVHREIVDGGGEASACAAEFFAGLSDAQVEALFHEARAADYEAFAGEARGLLLRLQKASPRGGRLSEEQRAALDVEVTRLRKRLAEIEAIDFFSAPGREAAAGLLGALEARLQVPGAGESPAPLATVRPEDVRGSTWVTRKGIHVDRIASAWLIRRFIDPEARFKFVSGKGYATEPGELRFDMFEAEFTHEGDRCTFEVLLNRFGLRDPALCAIAEIIHDIDLKETKFGRPERPGIERLVNGLAAIHKDDNERLARGSELLAGLYASFQRSAA